MESPLHAKHGLVLCYCKCSAFLHRNGFITLEDYMSFMISRETENVQSLSEVESAFRAITSDGDKPFVTKDEMFQVREQYIIVMLMATPCKLLHLHVRIKHMLVHRLSVCVYSWMWFSWMVLSVYPSTSTCAGLVTGARRVLCQEDEAVQGFRGEGSTGSSRLQRLCSDIVRYIAANIATKSHLFLSHHF